MTAASQLSVYNGACALIGERVLQSLTEDRVSRRALDDVWNRGGVNTCISAGLWQFAGRGIQWNYDSTLTPAFGYQCAYELPTDWVRWMMVCVDPYFTQPLLQYTGEGQFFYCDLQQVWVKYVSNDPQFGMNMGVWPDNFQRYVEGYFAAQVALRVTGSKDKLKTAEDARDAALKRAKSTDAQNDVTAMIPAGMWRQARLGRRANIERGNPSQLIG